MRRSVGRHDTESTYRLISEHPGAGSDHHTSRLVLQPVLDVAVAVLAAELAPAQHPAFEGTPECLRLDHTGELDRRRALAHPGARVLVGQVVFRAIPVLFKVALILLNHRLYGQLEPKRFCHFCHGGKSGVSVT